MYPAYMEESIRKVVATREARLKEVLPRLKDAEKTPLLQKYHPDYVAGSMRKLLLGPNKGDFTPNEIADLPAVQTPASAYSDLAGGTFMEEPGGSSTARPEPAFGFSVANLLAFLAIAPWKQNVDETTEDKPGNGRETPLSSIHV